MSLSAGDSSKDRYSWWRAAAQDLLHPLRALMREGKASLEIEGPASNHGAAADRLESFARPCLLAAHWLQTDPADSERLPRSEIAEWFRRGLLLGTDPLSPEYWGPTANHHQHTVEMCALTLALQIARTDLWEPFSAQERAQIATWLATIRGAGLHRNNHMFFNVMTLEFLGQEGFGRTTDRATSSFLLNTLESMALGRGWFIDGMNETVDYYNAYAFHYYGLWWAKLYGHSDPSRAERWKQWAADFLADYVHFFAVNGENPPFGRSLCYRFAASAPFALAELNGVSAIPPGLARRLCTRNLQFFLSHPIQQAQGCLSLGWTDEFPPLSEAYSCAGSPYWAAKGLAPLLLPPSHRFWQVPEEPLPAEAGDFQRCIPQAGLAARSHEGDIEVFNNATGICVGNTKFGTFKWGKLSYRTGFGFEISTEENRYPLDAALTAEFANGTISGRHQCQPIFMQEDGCGSTYGLGDRLSQNHVSVESRLWWKGGWQLHWHHVVAAQPALLRLGTYSLPVTGEEQLSSDTKESLHTDDMFSSRQNGARGIALQPLAGFRRILEAPLGRERTHILAPKAVTLVAETDWIKGEHDLFALTWAGRSQTEKLPWRLVESKRGGLVLRHPAIGEWQVTHSELPSVQGHEQKTLTTLASLL